MTQEANKSDKRKVLIVEDDKLMRLVLRQVIDTLDYETIEADNGATAMEIFRQKSPDIVVTDIRLPGKGGFDIISEMRALRLDVRIIAMSGGSGESCPDFIEQAMMAGADYALCKPFGAEGILYMLERCKF